MIRACVIGWPIEHSRSPLIHNHWLKRYSVDGSYDKVAVEPGKAADFMRSMIDIGLAGCNVTVPLKEIAFSTAQVIDPSAKAVGAANTLWIDESGRLNATNTDTYGFMTHLQSCHPDWRPNDDQPVAILGAGGAARAIIHGFKTAGIRHIHVYNRTNARARELADMFGDTVTARDWNERKECPRDASVIVNTTTIGMNGQGDLGIDFNGANPRCIVCDIVYVPLTTQLLKSAQANGLRTLDGLGMLLHQAAPGFEKWFGVRPQVTHELRDSVIANLNADTGE